jgi:hypothetical protein
MLVSELENGNQLIAGIKHGYDDVHLGSVPCLQYSVDGYFISHGEILRSWPT